MDGRHDARMQRLTWLWVLVEVDQAVEGDRGLVHVSGYGRFRL